MPKYLIQANYTTDGMKGVLAEGGTGRRDAVAKMVEAAGAQLELFYFAFGEDDAYLVVDGPDNVTAAAMSMMVNASGGATCHVTVLLTPEEVDAATQATVDYRPPGA